MKSMEENKTKTTEESPTHETQPRSEQESKQPEENTNKDFVPLPAQVLEEKNRPKTPSSTDEDVISSSSSVTVTVRRTPTIIEKKNVNARERYLSNVNSKNSSHVPGKEPSKIPSRPDKIHLRSSDYESRLSSSGIVSSPTSGAFNFALNSPNQPTVSETFSQSMLPAKTKKINISSGSFQATRQKFQRFSSPKPTPPSTNKAESSHST